MSHTTVHRTEHCAVAPTRLPMTHLYQLISTPVRLPCSVFPIKFDAPFPSKFKAICATIYKRFFRIYVNTQRHTAHMCTHTYVRDTQAMQATYTTARLPLVVASPGPSIAVWCALFAVLLVGSHLLSPHQRDRGQHATTHTHSPHTDGRAVLLVVERLQPCACLRLCLCVCCQEMQAATHLNTCFKHVSCTHPPSSQPADTMHTCQLLCVSAHFTDCCLCCCVLCQFIYFVDEFQLVPAEEQAPLRELIDNIHKKDLQSSAASHAGNSGSGSGGGRAAAGGSHEDTLTAEQDVLAK